MTDTKAAKRTGSYGEDLAAKAYEAKGYIVLERQYRIHGVGEADLILLKDNELVFAEVKTRKGISYGAPEESVNKLKQHRLKQVARHYINKREYNGVRFDVVSIMIEDHRVTVDIIEEAFL